MCLTPDTELPRKVVQLARRHELDEHVKPDSSIRASHLRIAMAIDRVRMTANDVVAFYSGIDWSGLVVRLLALVIAAMFAGWGYQELSMADWGVLLAAIGGAL